MPGLPIELLEKRGQQLAVACLKYAYTPKALQKALDPHTMHINGGAVGSSLTKPTKENAAEFINRVIDYFKGLTIDTSVLTFVNNNVPVEPLASWTDGLNICTHFPRKFVITIVLATGDLVIKGRLLLSYTECEETPADIDIEALTAQLNQSLAELRILREEIKEVYREELRADLAEIIEDFDLLKAYAGSNIVGEKPMTPKHLAELAVSRIRKKAINNVLQPLVQSIQALQTHVDAEGNHSLHRQKASAWAKQLLATRDEFLEGRSTFDKFIKAVENHCARDNIKSFTEYKGFIQRILEAFSSLIYRMTSIQFFKPAPATDKLAHNVVNEQKKLSVYDSSAVLYTSFGEVDENDRPPPMPSRWSIF